MSLEDKELPIPNIVTLPERTNIRNICCGDAFGIVVSQEGSLWLKGSFSMGAFDSYLKDVPRKILLPHRIKNLACNDSAALLLTESGQTYAWGEDLSQFGFLGIPGTFSLASPSLIGSLQGNHLSQIALGLSHAAGVDSSGHLYTWGTGNCGQLGTPLFIQNNHQPSVVESARIFTVKRVVCGDTFTCICTGGGYVYMYGVVGSHQVRGSCRAGPLMKRLAFNQASSPRSLTSPRRDGAKNHPYTLPELEQHFIAQVAAGDSFVAVLTDGGQVYVFDDCMELIKLPLSSHASIKTIAAGEQRGSFISYLYQVMHL